KRADESPTMTDCRAGNPSSRAFDRPRRRRLFLAATSALALLVALERPAGALDLRQLGAGSSATTAANAANQAAATQAAAVAAQSQRSLAAALRAIQAMQQAQSTARAAALAAPGTVPNGLMTGGLMPDSGLSGVQTSGQTTTYSVPTSWQ